MSRRARSRPDKRAIVYYTGEAMDIEAAFARLTAERKDSRESEPESITLKTGRLLDGVQHDGFPT